MESIISLGTKIKSATRRITSRLARKIDNVNRLVGVGESQVRGVSTSLIPDDEDDGSYLRRALRKENDKHQREAKRRKRSAAIASCACIYFRSYVRANVYIYVHGVPRVTRRLSEH